jgi:hypothetical protein
MARGRPRAALAIASLIVFGAVLGIAADRLYLAHRPPQSSMQHLHEETLDRFRVILDLDDAQVAAIDSIFRHRQGEFESTWRVLNHHLYSTVDSVHEEVNALLRPEQREAFRRWLREEGRGSGGLTH